MIKVLIYFIKLYDIINKYVPKFTNNNNLKFPIWFNTELKDSFRWLLIKSIWLVKPGRDIAIRIQDVKSSQ